MARKFKLVASKITVSNLRLKRGMSLHLKTSLDEWLAYQPFEKIPSQPNSTLTQLREQLIMSSDEKARMKTVKLLAFVSLSPIKLTSSIAQLIQATLIHTRFKQFWENAQHQFQILPPSMPSVSWWMTVTNASSTALPMETGLTQNSLVEQRNTPISQMEITPIRMRLQLFLSMDLVLKSTDSSHLNWDLLTLQSMANLLENLTSIQQEQLKKVY